jgi:PAS domain S-box-containing protein
MEQKKVLLVDDQRFALQLLRDVLAPSGFLMEEARDGREAFRKALEFQPDIILMDMVMPGLDGVEVCRMLKNDIRTSAIPVIVITANKNKENLVDAFEAGADDYITKPFSFHELRARILSNIIKGDAVRLLAQEARDNKALLEISQAVNSTLDTDKIMRLIVNRIAEHIPVNRCSITGIDDTNGCGYVLASSDAPAINCFRIDLQRYPEIREVVRTGQSLIVENMKSHPLMAEVRDTVNALDFNTLLVLPVIYKSEVIGTLVLRTLRDKNAFTPRELGFCQLAANVSAIALKNARLFERAKEESSDLREVTQRLERELREKEVFETLFAHASEGLVVLNVLGEPEYINDSALDILGTTRDAALNATFADFLSEDNCAEALDNHINFFLGKDYRPKLDLYVKSRDGGSRCVSLSISKHRLRGEFAILSLTDVTEERMNSLAYRGT